jgi:RNA polymerase sigma-70 factor (sigma-E family)
VAEPEAGLESFEEFAAGSLPALLRFGHVLTGSPQEAEDLVQEALAKSLRRWRKVRADDPVAYVRRVMVNTHLTRWRRWGSRVRLGDVPEAAAEDTRLARSQDWDTLRRALAQLPPRQRAVLVLRYLEDVPDEAIAAMLGCPEPPDQRPDARRHRSGSEEGRARDPFRDHSRAHRCPAHQGNQARGRGRPPGPRPRGDHRF